MTLEAEQPVCAGGSFLISSDDRDVVRCNVCGAEVDWDEPAVVMARSETAADASDRLSSLGLDRQEPRLLLRASYTSAGQE